MARNSSEPLISGIGVRPHANRIVWAARTAPRHDRGVTRRDIIAFNQPRLAITALHSQAVVVGRRIAPTMFSDDRYAGALVLLMKSYLAFGPPARLSTPARQDCTSSDSAGFTRIINATAGWGRHKGSQATTRLDWSEPCDLQGLQSKVIRPALEAVGLPASRPGGTKAVRMHDYADLRVMPTSARSSLWRKESRLMRSA